MKFRMLYLIRYGFFVVLFGLFGSSVFAEELNCDGPELSDEDIITIVKRERATRKVIPPAFQEAVEKTVHKQRCHYVYVEYPKKRTVGRNRVIVISRYGHIVDAYSGRSGNTFLDCPDVNYSVEDLQNFVNRQRKQYKDLPPRPKEYAIKMIKMRCMFVYYETPTPAKPNVYQTFTLDYYGDIYDFYLSK
ncbi:MAG: hypothetical protein ACI88A_002267 [Paraglaciecola sp.]|jgi:hypothetical protein